MRISAKYVADISFNHGEYTDEVRATLHVNIAQGFVIDSVFARNDGIHVILSKPIEIPASLPDFKLGGIDNGDSSST